MREQAAKYAIIRLQPHVETGEFANVGVVMIIPTDGYLDFRLETKRIARLTNFFGSLTASQVREILRGFKAELTRLQQQVRSRTTDGGTPAPDVDVAHLFHALTKNREGVVRFSDTRFAMVENPQQKLDELFARYVTHESRAAQYRTRRPQFVKAKGALGL